MLVLLWLLVLLLMLASEPGLETGHGVAFEREFNVGVDGVDPAAADVAHEGLADLLEHAGFEQAGVERVPLMPMSA